MWITSNHIQMNFLVYVYLFLASLWSLCSHSSFEYSYCCYAPSSSLECIFEENIKKRKRMRQNAKNGRKKRGHAAIVWIESYDKKQQTTYDAKKIQISGKPVGCNYLTVLSEFIRKIQRGKETIWNAINSVSRHREYLEHLIWIWY